METSISETVGHAASLEGVIGVEHTKAHTLKNTRWTVTVWNRWAEAQNSTAGKKDQRALLAGELAKAEEGVIAEQCSYFVRTVQKSDGSSFRPDSLQNIMRGINRFLRFDCSRNINMMDKSNVIHQAFRKAFEARVEEYNKEDAANVKKPDPITWDHINLLWQKGILNMTSAKGLSRAVMIYNGKVFGVRSSKDHKLLNAKHFEIGEDLHGQYVAFKKGEFEKLVGKDGRPNLRKLMSTSPMAIREYFIPGSPHCAYNVFKMYLQRIPPVGPFYRLPKCKSNSYDDCISFSDVAVGENNLATYIKTCMQEAGIRGYFTSRSASLMDESCGPNSWRVSRLLPHEPPLKKQRSASPKRWVVQNGNLIVREPKLQTVIPSAQTIMVPGIVPAQQNTQNACVLTVLPSTEAPKPTNAVGPSGLGHVMFPSAIDHVTGNTNNPAGPPGVGHVVVPPVISHLTGNADKVDPLEIGVKVEPEENSTDSLLVTDGNNVGQDSTSSLMKITKAKKAKTQQNFQNLDTLCMIPATEDHNTTNLADSRVSEVKATPRIWYTTEIIDKIDSKATDIKVEPDEYSMDSLLVIDRNNGSQDCSSKNGNSSTDCNTIGAPQNETSSRESDTTNASLKQIKELEHRLLENDKSSISANPSISKPVSIVSIGALSNGKSPVCGSDITSFEERMGRMEKKIEQLVERQSFLDRKLSETQVTVDKIYMLLLNKSS